MKNTTIAIITLAVGVALILTLPFATIAMGYPTGINSNGQGRGGYGMMGNYGGYGGMMGGAVSGSYGGYGGMMGGYNGNFGYMGSMMYNYYGNVTSWCGHFMSNLFGQGYSQK